MTTIPEKKLAEILAAHKLYLTDKKGGSEANLSEVDLRGADLREADLRGACLREADLSEAILSEADLSEAILSEVDLRGADLSEAILSKAYLSEADLRGAYLSEANLSEANLSEANLRRANLRGANLRGAYLRRAYLSEANLSEVNLSEVDLSGADLREADLRGANLSGANLSEATGLLPVVNFLEAHFERTDAGYIAYKTFNVTYTAPASWEIKEGAVISENVNFDRCTECGCGINVAPLEWVKRKYVNGPIWKVLIRWEWLCGVCVPYMSDGKIRCERVELLDVVI